jgi:hypothetical protein
MPRGRNTFLSWATPSTITTSTALVGGEGSLGCLRITLLDPTCDNALSLPATSNFRTTQEEYSVGFMLGDLIENSEAYCESKGIQLIREPLLGAGTDGTVWQTQEGTAVKAFERGKNYFLELECYRRFQDQGVNQILGFAVPELEGYSDSLMVVEMTIVEAPYLLDFGKVYLDAPPEYYADKVMMQN